MGVYCYTLRSDRIFARQPNDPVHVNVYHFKYAFKCSNHCSPKELRYQAAQQTRGEKALSKNLVNHPPFRSGQYYYITADKFDDGTPVYLTTRLRGWFEEEDGLYVGHLKKVGKKWEIKFN